MTSEAAKEIANKIDSLEEQASQSSFVAHGCHDVLIVAIGGPKHPSRELALPSELEVGPSATHVSTKESCVDPFENDPDTGDSEKCGLYVEENPPRLVALGRLYEGSTTVHSIPLRHDQVKVGVEEVRDAYAPIPVPTKKLLQVMWDAIVFGVFNDNFPSYIKHGDLSKIENSGQCLIIYIIQLWILHVTRTSMRAGDVDVYGFLEPQSIQRSGQSQFELKMHIGKWSSFCLRKILSSDFVHCIIGQTTTSKELLTGLDDTPQSESKATNARWIVVKCNRQKGSTECVYYVMHWMSTIILGSFKNNWETIIV
ncbi:hypothetical protein GmHk_11G033048 [Glycine max]|nr:hypothetical protein GmHk_11G033048 [Glycine max]